MTSIIPDWFQDNFVDIEQLLIDLFGKVFPALASADPVGIGIWEDDDWLDEPNPDPLLTFIRLPGGRVDYQNNYDECFIQATALTTDRDESNRMISVIRAVLLPMQGVKFTMNDGFTAQIICVDEVAGPQMLTHGQQVDLRVVPATFKVKVSLRNRTRYDAIIRGL